MKKLHMHQSVPAWLMILAFFSIAGLSGCGGSSGGATPATGGTNTVSFDLTLATRNSVPPLALTGTGTGTLTLDQDSGALSGTVSFSNLTGAATVAHIHTGDAGTIGGTVVDLDVDNTANQVSVPTGTTLDAAQMTAMLAGQYYVNIHTATNGGGEIRGQIVAPGHELIRVELNGDNHVPPVATANSGVGYLLVNTSSGEIRGNVTNTGLDDATLAHIHTGFAGSNGGVVVDLVKDGTNPAFWTFSDTLTTGELASLMSGEYYFNVHTPANGTGEVRGQIAPATVHVLRVPQTATEANTKGTNASGNSPGSAVAYVTVDTGVSPATVKSSLSYAGLNPNINAHIHTDTTGGVVIGYTFADATQGTGSATIDGTFTADQLTEFLNGILYINVHTADNPGGELAGQLTP